MAYKLPTLDETLGFLIALARGLLPTRHFGSRFVPGWKLLKTFAGLATDEHAHIAAAVAEAMPDTATVKGGGLPRWIGIVKPGGTATLKGATPARKANAGRVRGTLAAPFTVGAQLLHRPSGLLFQINESGSIPAALFLDVDIVAISTGSKTRLEKGQVLEFLQPPAGINPMVELQLGLDEDGDDQEQEGAARNRLLEALGTAASGGNQADFVAWCKAESGIFEAWCYPNRAGIGTTDIAAIHSGTGSARKLTAGERTTLLAKLKARSPSQVAGEGGALRILETVDQIAQIELLVTPNGEAQYAMDWDDSAGPATVLAWTAATRTLQFTTARPTTLKAGDRIVFKGVASSHDGAPVVVESLHADADKVILQTVPKKIDGADALPTNTDLVYAGGPLTAIIRNAILAHLNSEIVYAGPAGPLPASVAARDGISTTKLEILATGIGTANPSGKYGSWTGGILRGNLEKIAMYTRGVRNRNVVTPVADVEATDYEFPLDHQIGLINPHAPDPITGTLGYVLVRRG